MASRAAKRPSNQPPRSFLRRAFGFTLKWALTIAVWGVVAAMLVGGWYASDLPDADAALRTTRKPTATLVSVNGTVIATRGELYGLPVQLSQLPPALPHAVLATEDRRFYDHFGLDIIGLARAIWNNIRARDIVQGGSTITQQAAKNLFLTPERSLERKIKELMLALWLEHKFIKDQILTLYLNRVYFGAGTYGVDAAARRYFNKPAAQVSTYEAAMLAGLLKAPSRYNPRYNPDRAKRRTAQVLANMVDAGYLSEQQAKIAAASHNRPTPRRKPGGRLARHFVDWVLEQLPSFVAPGDRDLHVVTTLDATLQRAAETAVRRGLGNFAETEAALVALAPDGAIRAMVGSRDYAKSQFNRATQARRQPGSAFKPVVYLAGLEAGLTPDSLIADMPLAIGDWRPRNFDGKYHGKVTVAYALARSLNTVAVRITERVGRERVVTTARRLGITSDLRPMPSLALGAADLTLLELSAAYGPFANGGRGVWPYGIEEIRDGAGEVLYRRRGSGPGRVASGRHVAAMNRMLARVITDGTGRKARIDRPAAGKTGTSQNNRDAWFIGYSADLIAGVWVGNDDARPMKGITGGSLPATLWRQFMTAAHTGLPPRPLPGLGGALGAPPEPTPDASEKAGFWQHLIAKLSGERR
ncbi:MAG: Penicillin-binding protein 2D [Alphaproteobacteria bacterium MarineAlpha3_Bin4]|nr:MAG: Penicillin-binding protein 2D [Alphaproteobacteria bacterium MarineAlpha3_Bin4]